jgi:hypothetical protein
VNILELEGLGPREAAKRFDEYQRYLQSVKAMMPSSTFAFASAEWHYDFKDPRSPHDSWVESVEINEPASGARQERRGVEINVRLLGAFHNGHILLKYVGVRAYTMQHASPSAAASKGHGDWLIDEITLSPKATVVHAVRFSDGARWHIECDDIHYEWRPNNARP